MSEKSYINFDEIKSILFAEQNKLRTNPQSYIPILEEHINYFKDQILYKPNEIPVQTNEGKEAYLAAIEYLKTQQPLEPFNFDEYLSNAANDLVKDIGPKGLVSHDSSDGKNVSDRIEKYCEWDGSCGENLDFGSKIPVDIIINLLVDDGVEHRPHRKHLFNPDFKFVGIGIGEHKEYDIVVVIDYVGGVRPLGTPFYDYTNYKYQFPENLEKSAEKNKKPKNAFQLEDADAPDRTVSVKVTKGTKLYNGRLHKITKKFYTLEDGTTHIVEVEDV